MTLFAAAVTVPNPLLQTWVWLGFAVLAGVAVVFGVVSAVGSVRERQRRTRTQRLRQQLGTLMLRGRELQKRCANESEPPPNAEADQWAAKVESALESVLGVAYVARFRSAAGLPMAATPISSNAHFKLWSALHTRLARLDQFLAELRI